MRGKIIGNSAIYICLIVIEKGGWLLLLPLYTHYMSPVEFGELSLYLVGLSIFMILSTIGLQNAVSKIYYDIRDGRYDAPLSAFQSTIFISVFFATLILSLLIATVGSIVIHEMAEYEVYRKYLIIFALTVFFQPIVEIYKSFFQVKQEPINFALVSLGIFSIQTIVSLVLMVQYHFSILGLLYGMVFAKGFFFFVIVLKMIKERKFNVDKSILIHSLKYSLPLIPHQLSNWLIGSADRLMIKTFASLSSLGIYSLAFQLSSVITVLVGGVNMAWSPIMYKYIQKDNKGREYLSLISSCCMLIFAVLAAFILLFSKYAIFYVFNEAFYDAAYYMPPLIFVSLFAALQIFTGAPAIVSQPAIFSMVSLFSGGVNIVLNFILIIKYGAIGAVYATLVQKILSTYLYAYYGYRSNLKIDFDLLLLLMPILVLSVMWLLFYNSQMNILKDVFLFLCYTCFILFLAVIKLKEKIKIFKEMGD